jgi:uncharacterized protein (DUF2147 family)
LKINLICGLLVAASIAGTSFSACAQEASASTKPSAERMALAQKILIATHGMHHNFRHADGSDLAPGDPGIASIAAYKKVCGNTAINTTTPDNAHAGENFTDEEIRAMALETHDLYDQCQVAKARAQRIDMVLGESAN